MRKIHALRLDIETTQAQKQLKMIPNPGNFYASWRAECRAANVLHDKNDLPPERLLQAVWQHQRLRRDALKTPDGRPVRIFHPGFASVEGGPDFRGAVLQIGAEPPRSGDIEVDLHSHNWHAHGHDRNPNFHNVILHVIWDNVEAQGLEKHESVPRPTVLPLRNALDAPLAELDWWLENESPRTLPSNLRGLCSGHLHELDEARRAEILNSAAKVRLKAKAAQFRARAQVAGWEQSLWEGLFRALGYKQNIWPMHNLAESRLRWSRGAKSVFEFQARLLGIGGLLPAELTRAQKSTDRYLRRVWDLWWREREEFEDCLLPRAAWKFNGMRPVNHPQRRLALAAHWLAEPGFVSNIESWCAKDIPADDSPKTRAKCFQALKNNLQPQKDDFWLLHWTFRSQPLEKPQPLLGDARVTDLAVNAILPWLWVRAVEGGNEKLKKQVERIYFTWPAAEDNSVLKQARQRMFGTSYRKLLPTAAVQQGLIQIVRDFCEHANAVCAGCRFPELVQHR